MGGGMLKRHQVLLQGWLTDFIWEISEEYDISFSEVIRVGMSLYFGTLISAYNPKIKYPIKAKDIVDLARLSKLKNIEEIQHKLISRIYFETRKTIEARGKLKNKRK